MLVKTTKVTRLLLLALMLRPTRAGTQPPFAFASPKISAFPITL